MLVIINIIFLISLTVIIYYLIPEKSRELILLKRLKKKVTEAGMCKEPVREFMLKIIEYLEYKNARWSNKFLDEYKQNLEIQLVKAGLSGKISVHRFFAIQVFSMISSFFIYLVIFVLLLEVISFNIVYSTVFFITGFFLPVFFWLHREIKKRTDTILRHLPDTIDLLTLCVEAGLDFSAAIHKIAEKGREGPLRDEFILLEKEISMGAARVEALRNMAKRNDIDDLNSFLITLIQTVVMGTSLGPILRTQSEQLRIKRSQRAEKIAAQAPIKMLLPLLLCIFPTVFIVLFVPILFQVFGIQ